MTRAPSPRAVVVAAGAAAALAALGAGACGDAQAPSPAGSASCADAIEWRGERRTVIDVRDIAGPWPAPVGAVDVTERGCGDASVASADGWHALLGVPPEYAISQVREGRVVGVALGAGWFPQVPAHPLHGVLSTDAQRDLAAPRACRRPRLRRTARGQVAEPSPLEGRLEVAGADVRIDGRTVVRPEREGARLSRLTAGRTVRVRGIVCGTRLIARRVDVLR